MIEHRRKARLKRYLSIGIMSAEGITRDKEGEYAVCGLWFESYKKCPRRSACMFLLHEMNEVKWRFIRCPYQDHENVQKNKLTKEKISQLLDDKYRSEW